MLSPRPLAREHGFTLIEAIVAIATGIVVSLALFAILDVSSRQTGRISEVAQATNVGRTAMAHIVSELHSSCLKSGFAPVKSGSTESKLIFVNGYFPEKASEKTEPEYTFVRKNVIELNSSKQLTEEKSKASGEESSGEYPWTSLGKTTLASNIVQTTEGGEKPVFAYYKYNSAYATSTSEPADTLYPMTLSKGAALTAEQAKEVSAVEVRFMTEPYRREYKFGGASETGTSLNQASMTTLALGSPNSETTIEAKPCE